jgi:hypothetical protein
MPTIDELLDEIFAGQERVSRDEIQRRAVAASLAAEDLTALDGLPEGEYTQDEAADALGHGSAGLDLAPLTEGIAPEDLAEDDLLRELASLHRTRHETFLHASPQALWHHTERTAELEAEYVRRHPEREIEIDRLRSGARQRT